MYTNVEPRTLYVYYCVCVCVCQYSYYRTLNANHARVDPYAPVCSRWLTKRLVKRLLAAAAAAAASRGGLRRWEGGRPSVGGALQPEETSADPQTLRTHARERVTTLSRLHARVLLYRHDPLAAAFLASHRCRARPSGVRPLPNNHGVFLFLVFGLARAQTTSSKTHVKLLISYTLHRVFTGHSRMLHFSCSAVSVVPFDGG